MIKNSIIILLMLFGGNLFASPTWDIINKTMDPWNADGGVPINTAWISSQKGSGITVTQASGYVNITKTSVASSNNYVFLIPNPTLTLSSNTAYTFEIKARVKAIDKTKYPDTETNFESNQLSARLNSKNMAIHLKYGDQNNGYMSIGPAMSHNETDKYMLNTSEWHVYRFVFHADNTKYDVYVDDINEPVFENVNTTTMTGTNILRLGAETYHRCNMDIEYVKMGTGDFYSKPKINSLSVSSDSHIGGNERTISVSANTVLIGNGTKLLLSLIDKNSVEVMSPVEITVSGDNSTSNFTIPASVPIGKYFLRVAAPGNQLNGIAINPKDIQYVVTGGSPITAKVFPQVTPVGWAVADINNYQYKNTSNEFIFPSIVDTKEYAADGKFLNGQKPLARYYLFYAPHENPGGMYLATSNSLDGPWVERGIVVSRDWAYAVPNNVINTASHISACQVVWNNIRNQYFMYFHGPNTTTHYAYSDNLIDWTFGASIVSSTQFSPTSQEASYGKVFEHAIPGLGNKYVLMLMNQEGQIRRIYWAHSTDGINWTAVKKPLVSPDLDYKKIPGTDSKPDYAGTFGTQYGNVAAPYLIVRDGRYFVICHGSSGNMFAVEVGESFDMEIHWGVYMYASNVIIDEDASGNKVAVPRIASPQFIQDDNGKYYMFFEAGSRLGSNIAYAKEDGASTGIHPALNNPALVTIYPTTVARGQYINIEGANARNLSADVIDLYGNRLSNTKIVGSVGQMYAPVVPGLYFVKVTTDANQSKTYKIIVK